MAGRLAWVSCGAAGIAGTLHAGCPAKVGSQLSKQTDAAWGASFLRHYRGSHQALRGKAASASEESGGSSASHAPNDRDVDRKFTAQFNAFTAAYFAPHRRLWRWSRWRLKGLFQSSRHRPTGLQRCIAIVGYLLPLGVALRLSPSFAGTGGLFANLWNLMMLVTAPVSSPLGALTAASWLLCGVTDNQAVPSDFMRCHFRQALLLALVPALLVFQERAFNSEVQGYAPLLFSAMRTGLLGSLTVMWLLSVFCCVLGRYSVPSTDSRGSSQHVES
ncbi:unnamed protein product [Effrenium voratum]|nr:unnamed protein product [Effrenium voratum]